MGNRKKRRGCVINLEPLKSKDAFYFLRREEGTEKGLSLGNNNAKQEEPVKKESFKKDREPHSELLRSSRRGKKGKTPKREGGGERGAETMVRNK